MAQTRNHQQDDLRQYEGTLKILGALIALTALSVASGVAWLYYHPSF